MDTGTGTGDAATVARLTPPKGESGTTYVEAVAGNGLQTSVVYMPFESALDAETSTAESRGEATGDVQSIPAVRGMAFAILFLILAAAVFFIWRNRGHLRDLAGPSDRRLAPPTPAAAADPEIDRDLLERLKAEGDPRVGLRLILQRFLVLAAEENAIVMKRSLTTRELVRLLPGSFEHRQTLETLAQRAELVLFGGRDLSRSDYEACLELATPFLRRAGG
ncbi:DUF4129 domain-containing protein [Afifella aestuarii]|uniref:DUF4129 domain-containing protein n=1 Tax=Afifella aestuarii TaxID=1909496 RepID=UPI000FE3C2C5|nr:DUF4129 domain-containing protein [Afifella aestuarii]